MGRIILASRSPRRTSLLRLAGIPFEQIISDVPERNDLSLSPRGYVQELSRGKAEDVAQKVDEGLVIGADTVVSLKGTIMEKPKDALEAADMLSKLSGKWHSVFTGLTLIDAPRGRELSDVVATKVRMREVSPEEIRVYIATDEPLDKAGAYAIQGRGAVFIEEIEGCFYNVVGLPLARLFAMMREMGYEPWAQTML